MANDGSSDITFYDVLGVSQDATSDEIRLAYRRQAKQTHPDMGGSAHAMNLINRAYRVLKDPDLRAKYDRKLSGATEEAAHTYRSKEEESIREDQPNPADAIREEKEAVRQVKKAAWIGVLKGAGLLIAGVVITAIGYSMASPGSTYIVFWGLCIWGLIVIFQSWYHVLNPYASLHKVLDQPGRPYEFLLEKKYRRSWSVVVIIVSCLIGLFIIGAAASSNSNTSQALDSWGYSELYKNNFIESCVKNGGTAENCSCGLNVVETNYTYDQALELDKSSTLPDDLHQKVVDACSPSS